jgi:L-lysine 2,3-aminomutase
MSEPQSEIRHFSKNWQQQLAEAFNNLEDLCRYLNLSPNELPVSNAAAENFPLRVPLSFAACIEKGNPHDPLLRQVLPVNEELMVYPGFSHDPVGDLASVSQTGVLHKYQGRVLLINTGSCAINCRYCFRRNFPWRIAAEQARKPLSSPYKKTAYFGSDFKRRRPLAARLALTRLIRQLDGIGHVAHPHTGCPSLPALAMT